MLPDWETIRGVWPLLLGIAGLWARLEVALSRARDQSKHNEREIGKLERKVEDQAAAAQQQAIQLGRIEEAISGIGRTLDRLDRKIPGG
jgi:septal ring factor EnvC (AmiA/AmiB activator)